MKNKLKNKHSFRKYLILPIFCIFMPLLMACLQQIASAVPTQTAMANPAGTLRASTRVVTSKAVTEPTMATPGTVTLCTVTAKTLYVRNDPSMRLAPRRVLTAGTIVTILEWNKQGWAMIGQDQWINADFCEVTK